LPLLPKIVLLISGGSPLFAEERRQVTRVLTPRFCEMYGTAASGPMSALRGEDIEEQPTSVGRPFSFIDVEIVDDDDRALEPGAIGQLRCRGPGLTSPITTAPSATIAKDFRNGWYYPGELGSVDELGYIFLQGRTSEVIFRGGAKIFPSEVEAVLQAHECVAEAAVVGRALPNNEQEAMAFVVLKRPSTPGELLAHCRTRLTAFKVPREIRIVVDLPRNSSDKTNKRSYIGDRVGALDIWRPTKNYAFKMFTKLERGLFIVANVWRADFERMPKFALVHRNAHDVGDSPYNGTWIAEQLVGRYEERPYAE
jgi:acyl-coenzyme A synthetase/AMP-(fatty) acid ligase